MLRPGGRVSSVRRGWVLAWTGEEALPAPFRGDLFRVALGLVLSTLCT